MKFTVLGKGKSAPAGAARIVLIDGKDDDVVRLSDDSIEIGLAIGGRKLMTRRKLLLLSRRAVMAAKVKKTSRLVVDFDLFRFPQLSMSDGEIAEAFATNAEMAGYDHSEFLSDAKERFGEVRKSFSRTPIRRR